MNEIALYDIYLDARSLAESAMQAYCAKRYQDKITVEIYKEVSIKRLKEIATALGYKVVAIDEGKNND
jgi:signal recognition particle subunit SEC65